MPVSRGRLTDASKNCYECTRDAPPRQAVETLKRSNCVPQALHSFCGSRSPTQQPPRAILPWFAASIPSGPGRPYMIGTMSRLPHLGQGLRLFLCAFFVIETPPSLHTVTLHARRDEPHRYCTSVPSGASSNALRPPNSFCSVPPISSASVPTCRQALATCSATNGGTNISAATMTLPSTAKN